MGRIKRLGRYPKAVLLCLAAMVLAFAAAYAATTARVGFAYKDAIFVPREENGGTVYSGKLEGSPASFTVYGDQTVEFRCGDAVYGPYTAEQAPDAVPQEYAADESVTGVELFCAQELVFRGGAARWGDRLVLFNEDGSMADVGISVRAGGGVTLDENGNEIDPLEPSAYAVLELMAGPALTHKGAWPVWLAGGVCLRRHGSPHPVCGRAVPLAHGPAAAQCGRGGAVRTGTDGPLCLVDRAARAGAGFVLHGPAMTQGGFAPESNKGKSFFR